MNEDQLAVVDDDEEQAPVDADRERGYQIGRLMAFSDGVFAIAITLLVLNVAVPDIAQSDAQSRLPAALLQTGPRLLTFALSFFLVGFYWILHHQLFRQLTSVNVWLLWLNLVVLFLVSLLPFSSGVVGRYYDTVIGAEVYVVNLAAIALAFSALYLYATRGLEVRPPPGALTGLVSRGFLWPLVVVALVMVLAPVNLIVAYVIGATLMAVVGIYTAVPRTVRSAPLRGTGGGRLRVSRPAARVAINGQPTLRELFRASFGGPQPTVSVTGNTVDIEYRNVGFFKLRRQSAQVRLNAAIPWRIEIGASVSWLTADLTELQVTAVIVDGGASQIGLRLPRPSGTVPVHIRGGAGDISVRRPVGVAIRAVVHGGVSKLSFDERPIEAVVTEASLQSPDYAGAVDRYDFDFDGGATKLRIGKN
ncbi:MAG: TMEM175 family protein [Candidatus Dormibacteraeota bacterium]|nr:TMEM175 family protein [Candidatus Dormibacteraeota bacterium]